MVLSAFRQWEKKKSCESLVCLDVDFQLALSFADVFLEHSLSVLETLPKRQPFETKPNWSIFYSLLPVDMEFTRNEAAEIGKQVGISDRTVGKYLHDLLSAGKLTQERSHGPYLKSL